MSNRINELFSKGKKNVLSIYFTAGYPKLGDTLSIIETLEKSEVELIEIGMPFSDPLADGPVIQESSTIALQNGMSISLLFEQIKDIRKTVKIPLVLMGYVNPVMQYGVEKFIKKASEIGIDGTIIPDLPLREYVDDYKDLYDKYNLRNIFLITPQTSDDRIKLIDSHSNGFIYMVSSASTTGTKDGTSNEQIPYFERVKALNLKNPTMIGFGISDKPSFDKACRYASGAIIGTAFIKALAKDGDVRDITSTFVKNIKP
jgi:tryptophan synthase alpha chain